MPEVDKAPQHIQAIEDPRRALLYRITASSSFAKAPRLQELIIYLAERALQKPQLPVSEQQVGIAVFKRQEGYDTSADTIVRVQVSEVRKRLKYYFASAGANEPIVMELPRGSYVPNFYRRDVIEGVRVEASAPQNGHLETSLPDSAGLQPAKPVPRREIQEGRASPVRPVVLWLSLLLGVAIVFSGWLAYQNSQLRKRQLNPLLGDVKFHLPTGKCLSTSGGKGWTNTPFPVQTGIFTANFDATAGAAPRINDVIAFSDGAQTTISRFAAIVAFSETGYILARNGNSYTAANAVRFSPGETYHFRLVIDAPAHMYAVYVTPPHSPEITLGTNFAFRSEAGGVKSLNSVGIMVDNASGTITYCNFTVD